MSSKNKFGHPYFLILALTISGVICFFFPNIAGTTETKSQPTDYADFLSKLIYSNLSDTPVYGYRIAKAYPHDPNAFTQGLVFDKGLVYESTGLYGRSSVRKVELETGEVQKVVYLPPRYFGEGLALWHEKLIQLTWKSGVGFLYDKNDLLNLMDFQYSPEGWGITQDGTYLITSDGTPTLRFRQADTFSEVKRLNVQDSRVAIGYLNELEFIKGEIYANVWTTDYIARISPRTGDVLGWVDLSNLKSTVDSGRRTGVLNGIAYDPSEGRLFVTGKLWPKVFEIELIPIRQKRGVVTNRGLK